MSFFFLSTLIVYNLIKDMYNAERETYYNFHAYYENKCNQFDFKQKKWTEKRK